MLSTACAKCERWAQFWCAGQSIQMAKLCFSGLLSTTRRWHFCLDFLSCCHSVSCHQANCCNVSDWMTHVVRHMCRVRCDVVTSFCRTIIAHLQTVKHQDCQYLPLIRVFTQCYQTSTSTLSIVDVDLYGTLRLWYTHSYTHQIQNTSVDSVHVLLHKICIIEGRLCNIKNENV